MNIVLWVLQVLAALLYGASGVMKVFLFEEISRDVPSFGALPREAMPPVDTLPLGPDQEFPAPDIRASAGSTAGLLTPRRPAQG